MSHARIFLETLPLMMFEGKVDPELWPWKNPFHISQVICQPISFLSFYIYMQSEMERDPDKLVISLSSICSMNRNFFL